MNDDDEGLIALEDPGVETIKAPVLKVFDGDGFLTKLAHPRRNAEIELAVRFGFIDAPEMNQPGGVEAKDFLERRIGSRWVDLVVLTKMDTGGIVDRHGRMVCVPYLTHGAGPWGAVTRNIELEMVLNGWAWVLERYGPDEHYLEALEDARRHRRGIWARDDNVPPWEFKKQEYRRARAGPASSPQPDLFTALSAKVPCPTNGCGGHLVERTGRLGTFFGCSNYPSCRFSRPRS